MTTEHHHVDRGFATATVEPARRETSLAAPVQPPEVDVETRADWLDSRSPNTTRSYASQWRGWERWCVQHGRPAMPAQPDDIRDYLALRSGEGASLSTLRMIRSAIRAAHVADQLPDPTADPRVRIRLAALARRHSRAQRQAAPLTHEDLAVVQSVARRSARQLERRPESYQALCHARRDAFDVALIGLMRECLLRRSEAATITWADLTLVSDGSGRLLVAKSKTDQESEGATLYVSRSTMRLLFAAVPRGAEDETIFGIGPGRISQRISEAAERAGLTGRYSGHSPRVGMAVDLAVECDLPLLMQAGRWSSPTMPARYTRNQRAAHGGVAQWCAKRSL